MSSRTEFSKPVRRDARARAAGFCEFLLGDGTRCGCALTTGKFAYDHVIPDWMGGEATIENCQVICTPCHTVKTRQDAADRAKVRRQEDRHQGIRNPSRIQSQGFRKFAPARRASSPIPKLTIAYQRDR